VLFHTSLISVCTYHTSKLTWFQYAEFPEQGDLIKARDNVDAEEHIAALKEGLRAVAKNVLNAVFEREGVNIIAAPADSSLCIHAAASGMDFRYPTSFVVFANNMFTSLGYPIATVPLGKLRYNGRPFGLCLVAKEDEEDKVLQFMAAYEAVSAPRAVPEL
jgi:amidase